MTDPWELEPGTRAWQPRRIDVPQTSIWQDWWRSRPVPAEISVAREQGFILSTTQCADAGITRAARRHAVATGRWTAAGRAAVGVVDVRDGDADAFTVRRRRHALEAAAATITRTGHVVAARSASIAYGLPTLHVPEHPELLEHHTDVRGHRNSSHVFAAALDREQIGDWFGVPITDVARTLVDLGRHDRRDAIMAADLALRDGLVTCAQLDAALASAAGWPGVRQAREVLAIADPRAESPLESITRLALHDDGFPAPELQFPIGGYWVDFCWPQFGLVLEADGLGKYRGYHVDEDDPLVREKLRAHVIAALGWRVERVILSDVVRFWRQTSSRLRAAMLPSYPQGSPWGA